MLSCGFSVTLCTVRQIVPLYHNIAFISKLTANIKTQITPFRTFSHHLLVHLMKQKALESRLYRSSQLCLVYLHEKHYLMESRLFFFLVQLTQFLRFLKSQIDNSGAVSRQMIGCFVDFESYFDKKLHEFIAALFCLFSFQN